MLLLYCTGSLFTLEASTQIASTQTEPLAFFELPMPVTMLYRGSLVTKQGLVDHLINSLFSASIPLTSSQKQVCTNMYIPFLREVNVFQFYASVVECYSMNAMMQVVLQCEERKDFLINLFVENIAQLADNFVISDTYVKSFLAFFGKSIDMLHLYRSKNYERFVVDCFLKPPIVKIEMLVDFNYTSGDLLPYFVMERSNQKVGRSYSFVNYVHGSQYDLRTDRYRGWVRLQTKVAELKPLQLMGIVRSNKVLIKKFSAAMQIPYKKSFLVNFVVKPLKDQLAEGSINFSYLFSFLCIFRVKWTALEFFKENNWDEFLSVVATDTDIVVA